MAPRLAGLACLWVVCPSGVTLARGVVLLTTVTRLCQNHFDYSDTNLSPELTYTTDTQMPPKNFLLYKLSP